ncbi:YchJ family protein [Parafrigoribacterium humi]|uniref:YchJ family protein n=1 Tax=Parafrigoribacterium humi TaxID=3144664 RepID=UPI0032ED6D52
MNPSRCPCLSGLPYDECCGPLHRGEAHAPTAERLMRSRFSAFAIGDVAYLLETWHPRTRPPELELDPLLRWYRLDILAVSDGGILASSGTVEFRAYYRSPAGNGEQHELSRFVKERGRWFYVDPA